MKMCCKLNLVLFALVFFYSASAQEVSKCDRKFTEKMMGMGLMQVKTGEQAQTKAVTPDVKASASQMIESHTRANVELTNLATRKNIAVPSALSKCQQKKIDKLSKCEGKKFDKKFTTRMIKSHKKGLCVLKKEARRSKDSELRTWANTQVPIYKSHITMWKDACKKIK